jgi:hypothetical protein
MSQATLKLVELNERRADTLPFERRRAKRHIISGHVTALRTSTAPSRPRNHISSLRLLNISDGGVGAIAPEPVEIGSPICLFFPPHGSDRGMDLYGHVVRCISRGSEHEVGIRFDIRPAA